LTRCSALDGMQHRRGITQTYCPSSSTLVRQSATILNKTTRPSLVVHSIAQSSHSATCKDFVRRKFVRNQFRPVGTDHEHVLDVPVIDRRYTGLPELSYPSTTATSSSSPAAGPAFIAGGSISQSSWPARSSASRKSMGNRACQFMHYDRGYFDLEQKTLQPPDNPFGPKPIIDVSATTTAP
jgi:hypothetical protein